MVDFIRLVGPNRAVELLGIRLVGVNAENGIKFLMSLLLIGMVLLLGRWFRRLIGWTLRRRKTPRMIFWVNQGTRLFLILLLFVGLLSIWFDDPMRLATAVGLVTAGLAFALQKVVTAIAGYFVILQGGTFSLGDRIVMGGVRGDVVSIELTQTTIMEMGQPPSVQNADPAMWVQSRQYTGRLVTVSNAKIFDEPVFNYTRNFPYLWEEMSIPLTYQADRRRAEEILLEVARRHTVTTNQLSEETLREMQRRYFLKPEELGPKVYYRLTDNWLELTLRFIVKDHGMREVKNQISREILEAFDAARLGIASATVEIVGLPPLRMEESPPLPRADQIQ